MVQHPIPPEAMVGCVAIVGRTGSGKTTAARGAVENLLDAGERVVIVDPAGAWWGLRSLADGKAAGYAIPILGGDHADLPLPDTSGASVAAYLVETGASAVVDTSAMTMAGRRRFYEAFLGTLYEKNRAPLHLIVDEADELAPQRPLPDGMMVLHRMEQIVRRGRVRGFRPVLITQRPAVLNKNVLSQAGCLVAMQLTASQDRAALGAWIEGQASREDAKAMLAALPRLEAGEGFVWFSKRGGPIRALFPLARTWDSGRTPTGDEILRASPTIAVDLEALQRTIEGAEKPAKAKSARAAHGTVEVALTADEMARSVREARTAGYGEGFSAARIELGRQQREVLQAFEKHLHDSVTGFIARLQEIVPSPGGGAVHAQEDGNRKRGPREASYPGVIPAAGGSPALPTVPARGRTPAPGRTFGTTAGPAWPLAAPADARPAVLETTDRPTKKMGAELRILRVLAQRHPARLTVAQWATLSGLSKKGGTWSTYVSRLRVENLIREEDGLVDCTQAGLARAGAVPQQPGTPAEVLAMWKTALGGGPGKLLDVLVGAGADGLARGDLARAAELTPSGGTFSTYLSKLRTNGLVNEHSSRVRVVPELLV